MFELTVILDLVRSFLQFRCDLALQLIASLWSIEAPTRPRMEGALLDVTCFMHYQVSCWVRHSFYWKEQSFPYWIWLFRRL